MNQDVQSIWQQAAIQLFKDCGKEFHRQEIGRIGNKAELIAQAIRLITSLVEEGGQALTSALYRLDIPEKSIRMKTRDESPDDRLTTVAIAAAERCIQKVEMRRLYSNTDTNG